MNQGSVFDGNFGADDIASFDNRRDVLVYFPAGQGRSKSGF